MPKNVLEGIEEILKNQEDERARDEEILEQLRNKKDESGHVSDADYLIEKERRAKYQKNFFLLAEQHALWVKLADFTKQKMILLASLLLTLLFGVWSTAAVTDSEGYYTTFSLFENIWLVFCLFRVIHTLLARRVYRQDLLASNSPWHYELSMDGLWHRGKKKKRHKVFFVLCVISVLCNVFCCLDTTGGMETSVYAAVLEFVFLALMIVSNILYHLFFSGYTAVRFCGDSMDGKTKITLIWDLFDGCFYKAQDWQYDVLFRNCP